MTCFLPFLLLQAAASVFFEKELENQAVMEGKSVLLSCEVSSANVPVTWKKDNTVVEEGGRYILKKKGPTHTLEIKKLCLEDAGEFCCISRGKKTTAKLIVRGKDGYIYLLIFGILLYLVMSFTAQEMGHE